MTKQKAAVFLLGAIMVLSTSCSPGLVSLECDAYGAYSHGLGKLFCELTNIL